MLDARLTKTTELELLVRLYPCMTTLKLPVARIRSQNPSEQYVHAV